LEETDYEDLVTVLKTDTVPLKFLGWGFAENSWQRFVITLLCGQHDWVNDAMGRWAGTVEIVCENVYDYSICGAPGWLEGGPDLELEENVIAVGERPLPGDDEGHTNPVPLSRLHLDPDHHSWILAERFKIRRIGGWDTLYTGRVVFTK
jgi:hypothetical protein